VSGKAPAGWLRRTLVRTLIIASVIAGVLILVFVLLDFFGSQPQPFQYILH
jgi:hypothetical protein